MVNDMLFSEKEIRDIFERSLLYTAPADGSTPEEGYSLFRERLSFITESFDCDDKAEFMFGKQGTCYLSTLPFFVFFNAVRVHFSGFCGDKLFLPAAFSEWGDSFCESLSQLFGSIALEELQDMVGELTTPSEEWISQKAMPAVRDGRLFHTMALRYPLYARQVTEFVFFQIHHIEEIISAMKVGLSEIGRIFQDGRPRMVRRICASASDRHNGGKTVHTVIFDDDSRVVYKPHSAATDNAFRGWVDHLAERSGERPFPSPDIIDTGYGTLHGFVRSEPLARHEDAAEYFRRAGFLTGAVYLLRGNDLHAENIIACGVDPVIVDTETVIAPRGCMVTRLMGEYYRYSVNSMALFHSTMPLPGLREGVFAGLCDIFNGSSNLPVYDGQPISCKDYADELCAGFEKAVRAATSDIKSSETMLISLFENCGIRMVLRPTQAYMRILTGLCCKEPQTDPAFYRRLMERKFFKPHKTFTEEECAVILDGEQAAFERLDVPYFEERLDKEMLMSLADDWKQTDDALIVQECKRIRFSLADIRPDAGSDIIAAVPDVGSVCIGDNARRLAARLIPFLDGMGHCISAAREQRRLMLSDTAMVAPSLLDGTFGVLISLKAYSLVFGTSDELEKSIKEAAEKLLDPAKSAPALTSQELGIADGTAGYIIGCGMCHEMGLQSDDEYAQALGFVGRIADDELRLRCGETGLIYGNCGIIYALAKVPAEFMTPQLSRLEELVWSCISSRQEYLSCSRDDIINAVSGELIRSGDITSAEMLSPVGNNSLRYGNAGRLYKAAQSLCEKEDSGIRAAADRLCAYLVTQEHIVCGTDVPDKCVENGLLHGMPGVLYSICRYLRPDIIPGL